MTSGTERPPGSEQRAYVQRGDHGQDGRRRDPRCRSHIVQHHQPSDAEPGPRERHQPVDRGPGPCPPPPENRAIGDCAPGHFFAPKVAISPLHPHTTSGIIHIESDRPGTFTLGQFFDEWGVHFNARCVGGYCTGNDKELRVFVGGKRVSGDPRRVVLRNRQEIAVVFGGRSDFRSVPSTYTKRWPAGCGGPAEPPCIVS